MSRNVVFLGNCQMGTLAHLYSVVVGDLIEDKVTWIPTYEKADGELLAALRSGDVLVRQVLDFLPQVCDIDTGAAVFLFPHVAGSFLWPNAGRPHPRNMPAPMLDESGPYSAELGDSFLDRMIANGVSEQEAVIRYLDTDVATARRVDRLMELVLDRQRQRDSACGYNFCDFIATEFRDRRLFRSQNHPETELTLKMASALFTRMGVPDEVLAAIRNVDPGMLFPPTEAPLHPSVISHFGLTWADKNTRYRFFHEGRFTFAEYAARYMRYEWNSLLAEAFHWFWAGEKAKALQLFCRSLPASPRSAIGRAVYADLLVAQGDLATAEVAALEAAVIEPDSGGHRERIRHIMALRQAGGA